MYPAPEVCLDLKTWQEFYGFDKNGEYAGFEFDVDTEKCKVTLGDRPDEPIMFPRPGEENTLIRDPKVINKVNTPEYVNCDINGEARNGKSLPGPFLSWEKMIG